MIKHLGIVISLITLILCSSPADASLWGNSVDYIDLNDQRTFGSESYSPGNSAGGLSGGNTDWPGFSVSWNISYDVNSLLWNYEYTFDWTSKYLSNVIIELSGESTALSNISINDPSYTQEGPKSWSKSGHLDLPNTIFGTKWEVTDTEPTIISFQSASDPVWGNFFAKSGKIKGDNIFAYNNAMAIEDFDSSNKSDFIVRPDGGAAPPVAPEPVSSVLFVAGGTIFGFKRFLKKS